jgi:hypothetical protein
MRRIIGAFLLIVASTATGSAQGLFPSVWQTQGGAVLKVLWVDAGGNFSGVFISSPGSPCPGVPYNLAGSIRGPRVFFQTSRSWTPDCNMMSFGPNRQDCYDRAIQMCADICNGGPVPPVYEVQDANFELVVNKNKATHFGRWPLPSVIADDPRLVVV